MYGAERAGTSPTRAWHEDGWYTHTKQRPVYRAARRAPSAHLVASGKNTPAFLAPCGAFVTTEIVARGDGKGVATGRTSADLRGANGAAAAGLERSLRKEAGVFGGVGRRASQLRPTIPSPPHFFFNTSRQSWRVGWRFGGLDWRVGGISAGWVIRCGCSSGCGLRGAGGAVAPVHRTQGGRGRGAEGGRVTRRNGESLGGVSRPEDHVSSTHPALWLYV